MPYKSDAQRKAVHANIHSHKNTLTNNMIELRQ